MGGIINRMVVVSINSVIVFSGGICVCLDFIIYVIVVVLVMECDSFGGKGL